MKLTSEETKAIYDELPQLWNPIPESGDNGMVGNFYYEMKQGQITLLQLELGIDFMYREIDKCSINEINEMLDERR
jgi:hypothetical protein